MTWRRWTYALVGLVCVALVVSLAVLSNGYPVRKLDLNDSGVWVTNDAERMFGRVNKAAMGLDAWLDAPGGAVTKQTLDVLQDGSAVLEYDAASAVLVPVNTSSVANSDSSQQLAAGSAVAMRAGTIAALDPVTGRVFAVRYDPRDAEVSVLGLGATNDPVAQLGATPDKTTATASIAVDSTGAVVVAYASGKLLRVPSVGDGFGKPVVTETKPALKGVQIAAVGDRVVIYDNETGLVAVTGTDGSLGASRTLPTLADPAGVLQASGDAADTLLVATSSGLFRVGLDDGVPTALIDGISGRPAVPVHFQGCDFGAFGDASATVVRACGAELPKPLSYIRDSGALVRPVFRTNRAQLVLNDAADGRVFDLDNAVRLDAWKTLRPKTSDKQTDQQQTKPNQADAKPVANPDTVGVRAGSSAIGYLLDNDTNSVASVLMIESVSNVPPGARVEIAPDGQSVAISVPADGQSFSFSYTISNGTATATGQVRVPVRAGTENARPQLREHHEAIDYTVSSFGALTLSVLGDWRDADGDAVAISDATVDGQPVPVTPEGNIEFVAGREETDVAKTLTYAVTDGRSEPVTEKVSIKVLGVKAMTGTAPVARPDSARGQVGRPLVLNPLANDIPGSDPRTPDARLTLGAEIRPVAGLRIESDPSSGLVTITPEQAGSYTLEYVAAFGSARMSRSNIRVDIAQAGTADQPVVMPDQAMVRGTGTVRIDPLANDLDPRGGLLTITAVGANENDVAVAAVSGRWVLITPRTTTPTTNPTIVKYTVSNGFAEATGDIAVTMVGAPELRQPLVRDDAASVRAGDSVLVNVLSNDVAPDGQPLTVVSNLPGRDAAGSLHVYDPSATQGDGTDLGEAFVHNNHIRYVAPANVEAERQVVVEYYAQAADHTRSSTGRLRITIRPQPTGDEGNRAPTPKPIEVRVTAGDRVHISIDPSSQDPDGDTVTVTGIGYAPALGRVTGFSPTGVTYEAYPDPGVAGTDTFSLMLTDRYGKQAAAVVRVGVTPPGQPQVPMAVADQVFAEPGAVIRVDALANDMYSRADKVRIADLASTNDKLPVGAELLDERGPVKVVAPGKDQQPTVLSYALTGNGGVGGAAPISVTPVEGYKNPPVIFDEVAKVQGTSASVDVLKRAWDPDGDDKALKVTLLGGAQGSSVSGGVVTVPLTEQPQVVPYQVTDETGATSAAVVFVPSAGTAAPHLKSGGLIQLDKNGSATLNLADYVFSPREKQVAFVPDAEFSGSPKGKIEVEPVSATSFKVTAKDDYLGPGAVTFHVMDEASLTEPGVLRAVVSVPVQVGPATPVLRCPTTELPLVAGGADRSLDIATLCHVWLPNPDDVASLVFTGDWQSGQLLGVDVEAGKDLTFRAGGSAIPASRGTVMVGVRGTQAVKQPVNVVVREAAKPTMASQSFTDILQGTPLAIPLGVRSPLRDAKLSIVSLDQVSGPQASGTTSGTTVTITPASNAHGTVVYKVVATDVADTSRTDRHVEATLTLEVYGIPDAPTAPVPGQRAQSHAESLVWTAPPENGAPITQYRVTDSLGKQTICAATSCQITGLANNVPVTFTVAAYNKAGWGPESPSSRQVIPDQPPPAPTGLAVSNPLDRRLTLSWSPVVVDGSPVKTFHILIDGKEYTTSGSATSFVVPTPENNSSYPITLIAENNYDVGPPAQIVGQSAGQPLGLQSPTFQAATLVGAATAVRLTWTAADKNGPADLTYSVVRNDGKTICPSTLGTTCTDDSVQFQGQTFTYTLTAVNGAGGAEHTSRTTGSWTATGTPERPSTPTATATGVDRQVQVSGSVPDSRGRTSTLKILANGSEVASVPIGNARGDSFNRTVSIAANGAATAITLQVCNETRCGPVSSGSTVTAYGPIGGISIADAGRSGNTVSYRVSVNPNGKPVTVSVNGSVVGTTDSRVGSWTGTWSENLGYSGNKSYTATATDGTRSATSNTITLTTPASPPPPPPTPTPTPRPTITPRPTPPPVTRRVTPASNFVDVGSASYAADCGPMNQIHIPGCFYLFVSTSGFSGQSYTCTSSNGLSKSFSGNVSNAYMGMLGWSNSKRTVSVTCSGVSGSTTWGW